MSSYRHDTPPVLYGEPVAAAPTSELPARERALLDLVNQRVVTAPTLDGVIDALFDDVAPIFSCDRMGLAFLDEQGEHLTSTHAVATYTPLRLTKGFTASLEGSSLAEVIRRGVPRLIGDLEQYLVDHPDSDASRLAVAEGIRSSMTCPLVVDDRAVGVLFLSSRAKWAFGEMEVRLFQAITDRLSRVVERAWRLHQVEAANSAYFEMLGFVSHELKSPVAGLATDARLLRSGYLGPLNEKQGEKLDRMVRRAEYLLGLVNDYLDLARVERADLTLAPADLADVAVQVLAPALDVVEPLVSERGLRVTTELPPTPVTLRADPTLLRIVLVNLLSNAAKYSFEGGGIHVRLSADAASVEVAVRNDGPGFAAGDRPKLFRRFSRLTQPAVGGQKGTGVGLYTVSRVVRLHGGKVRATSEEGRWAEFTVTLPTRGLPAPTLVQS